MRFRVAGSLVPDEGGMLPGKDGDDDADVYQYGHWIKSEELMPDTQVYDA